MIDKDPRRYLSSWNSVKIILNIIIFLGSVSSILTSVKYLAKGLVNVYIII